MRYPHKGNLKLILILLTIENSISYPQYGLKCQSSLTRPDHKLICPQSRNRWCVKEVVDTPESVCGITQYYGDIYAKSQCIYKKCASDCEEGVYQFTYDGQIYTRTVYCCNNADYCNVISTTDGYSTKALSIFGIFLIAILSLYLFF